MTAKDADPGLWDYAVGLYSQPGVPQACLDIQEQCNVDVPLLLFGAWLGGRGMALTAADCRAIDGQIRDWRVEVIHALRRVRRRMKSGPPPAPSDGTEDLREAVKAAELDAERIELQVLETLGDDLPNAAAGTACIAGNMRIVLDHFEGATRSEAAAGALERIIEAAARQHAVSRGRGWRRLDQSR
jgi:uncharacterized protein (TIGR02444 family)